MAFGGEVASMFVRIRPNLSGFSSELTSQVKTAVTASSAEINAAARANVEAATSQVEANKALAVSYQEIGNAARRGSTEAAVAAKLAADATVASEVRIGAAADTAGVHVGRLREHFLNLTNALGLGFGAAIGVKLVKDLTDGAANVQKSAEVIRNSFGASSNQVLVKFGDTAKAALGISAQTADAVAAKFGILFKNLGIAQPEAAGMTVNLIKLAGSLSAIKGVDPTTALNSITLAMLGNTRSLKQLGVSVDPATEKLAALKLGLISTTKDAFTPAIRAQAIYALATANLGSFQKQAAQHAGDYATIQRRLSAEWSNAKDIIGTELLPVFDRYATRLANWLSQMNKSGQLQRDVNHALRTAKNVIDGVRSALGPIIGLWHGFTTAVGGTKNAVKLLLVAFLAFKAANLILLLEKTALAVAGIGTKADGALGRIGALRLALTRLSGLVIPITIAVGFTYFFHKFGFKNVIDSTLNPYSKTGGTLGPQIANDVVNPLTGFPFDTSLDAQAVAKMRKSGQINSFGFVAAPDQFGGKIGKAIRQTGADIENEKKKIRDAATSSDKRAAEARLKAYQATLDAAKKAALASAKSTAAGVADATKAMNSQVEQSVVAAKTNLDSIGSKLSATIDKFLAKSHKAIGGGGVGSAAFQNLKKLVESGSASAADIQHAALAAQTQVATAASGTTSGSPKDAIKRNVANLTDEFNKGALTVTAFQKKVAALLHHYGIDYKKAGKANGSAFADGFRSEVHALLEQAKAIGAVPARFRHAGDSTGEIKIIRPLEVLRTDQNKIAVRAEHQRERQIKASEKATALAAKNLAQLHAIAHLKTAMLPGQSSTKAKKIAHTGIQP